MNLVASRCRLRREMARAAGAGAGAWREVEEEMMASGEQRQSEVPVLVVASRTGAGLATLGSEPPGTCQPGAGEAVAGLASPLTGQPAAVAEPACQASKRQLAACLCPMEAPFGPRK